MNFQTKILRVLILMMLMHHKFYVQGRIQLEIMFFSLIFILKFKMKIHCSIQLILILKIHKL